MDIDGNLDIDFLKIAKLNYIQNQIADMKIREICNPQKKIFAYRCKFQHKLHSLVATRLSQHRNQTPKKIKISHGQTTKDIR